MNVFRGIIGFLTLLPYIVAGAEKLHDSQSGAEKKQAVMQLATIALEGAAMAAPGAADKIASAAPDIGTAIDGIVGALNKLDVFGHKAQLQSAPAAAPAAQ